MVIKLAANSTLLSIIVVSVLIVGANAADIAKWPLNIDSYPQDLQYCQKLENTAGSMAPPPQAGSSEIEKAYIEDLRKEVCAGLEIKKSLVDEKNSKV
jgi:hypothetical protein